MTPTMRPLATTVLFATLLVTTLGATAGAERPTAPHAPRDAGLRVSADQAQRRMAACLRRAPLSADHHERHAMACVDRVSSGRL